LKLINRNDSVTLLIYGGEEVMPKYQGEGDAQADYYAWI
jgi:hypothetical protein